MKLINKLSIALMALTTLVGTPSCSSDDYEMVSKPDNAQVYFSNENSFDYLLAENQNTVEVEVSRVNTEGALTVNISATDESALFSIPSSVTFEDGKSSALLPITFDFNALTPDQAYVLNLKLQGETSVYGDAEVDVNIKYAPWSQWAPISDDYPTYTYTQLVSGTYQQEVYYRESMLNPSLAQLMLVDWFYGVNLIVDWDKAKNRLSVAPQYSGYNHSNYGAVNVADGFTYWTEIRDKEGAFDDYVSYYDEGTGKFMLNLAYYVPEGAFGIGYEILQLPGFEQKDFSLNVKVGGSYLNGKDLGIVINLTMGEDVASMKYAVFAGTLETEEIKAKADGIFSGDIESTYTTENGNKVILVPEEGDYTVVVVLYDADNNRVGEDIAIGINVTAPTGAESWTPLFTGDYEYVLFFGSEEEPEYDEGLTLYVNDKDPSLYKIANWGNGVDFVFSMDEDGRVLVQDIFTGYTHPKYGDVFVDDVFDYTGSDEYGVSYYNSEEGTFYFNLVYYVEAGEFGVGYERFKLTASAQASMSTRAQKTNNFNPSASVIQNNIDKNKEIKKFNKSNKYRLIKNNPVLN